MFGYTDVGAFPFKSVTGEIPNVSLSGFARNVEYGHVFLHENPKRQLTPNDVGRVVKTITGTIAIIKAYYSDTYQFSIDIWLISRFGSTSEGRKLVTHIRNDNGQWEELDD